ncbi:NAD(P)H-dependent oxidoreductase [Marinobacter confluentis]|uniref:Flavodoxin family protein n=1 Tax=Marinobacter confluentis TaxID=1697557 RepID=A0A4Z1BNS8_9GAMM|nr:NAD(P)H-dependent oxidoreductase [Marinobacter confluentis]TGN39117.1 flavodoxin family protein [Marinobacter confluentis]
MNILIVLAHPERKSFNGALVDTAKGTLERAGHEVQIDDLYAENFDPVERAEWYANHNNNEYFAALTEQSNHFKAKQLPEDVNREISRLDWADLVIFQFPLWWHAQPAILKGWFDRVLVYGGLYSGRMRYDHGYFRGKKAMCSVTTGSPAQTFMPFGRAGNMVEWLWPFHSSLNYIGFNVLPPNVSYGVQAGGIQYQEKAAFEAHLETQKTDWASRLRDIEQETPIPFTGWSDWNEDGVLRHDHPMRWRP